MNKQVRILSGLHRGAEVAIGNDEQCIVGSDPECSVVLFDPQVAPRHCLLQKSDQGITCRALEASVTINDHVLAPGEAKRVEDFSLIRCGQAAFSVGPAQGEWKLAERALNAPARPRNPGRSLSQVNPYALFATVLLGITCVIGLAYAALSSRSDELTRDRIEAARQWLTKVAPKGSELTIGGDITSGHELLLTGYVRDDAQMRALLSATRASDFTPRMEVYSVEGMSSSMQRLLRLAEIPCELKYENAGQFSCLAPVPSESVAMRLRTMARDVPGLRGVQVAVSPPPSVVAAAPAAEPAPAVYSGPTRLTQRFSVLMIRDQRYLIGQYGQRYREGDLFDGFTVKRIGVDKILFERDSQQFEFYVAALGRSQ